MHRSAFFSRSRGRCTRTGCNNATLQGCTTSPVTVPPISNTRAASLLTSREYVTINHCHYTNKNFSSGRFFPASVLSTTTSLRAPHTNYPILFQNLQQYYLLHTFHVPDENLPVNAAFKVQVDGSPPPFTKLLAANRGEISCRINRAASELGITTAGIYSHEGMY
jgi:hypothetical protein